MNRMTYLIDESGNIERIWPTVKADGHAAEIIAALKGA